jgi:hypothetical protein
MSAAATRHLTGERDADLLRRKLELALIRIPARGLIFTRAEVDRIAEALGGYTELLEVLNAGD